MKMKTLEKIRLAEIISIILLAVATEQSLNENELIKILQSNGISLDDLNSLRKIMNLVLDIDILSSFIVQTTTKEYKEMKNLYDKVVENTSQLTRILEFDNPIQIFALYVYLYRNGYLSNDKYFTYSTNMKDFAKLGGVDVVRGSGVCRSISSFLTDLYLDLGFKATNVCVNASSNACHNLQKLSDANLNVQPNSKAFVKFVSALTKVLPIANHQISMVTTDEYNYILDPTNDGYLKRNKYNRLTVPNVENSYMNIVSLQQLYMGFLSTTKLNYNLFDLYNDLNIPSVSDAIYRENYLNTLKICRENIDLLEGLYNKNKTLYKDIFAISEQQRDMIGRMLPIISKNIQKQFRKQK